MSIARFKIRKWRATFIRQSNLCWWMWLVQSVFERAVVVGRLSVVSWESDSNFHMWTGVKNFRPESGVKFFIHEIFHTWNRCEFSIRHVQPCSTCEISNLHSFQTCFWCESGMKQTWSYENIRYGVTSTTPSLVVVCKSLTLGWDSLVLSAMPW